LNSFKTVNEVYVGALTFPDFQHPIKKPEIEKQQTGIKEEKPSEPEQQQTGIKEEKPS
jgi:hypothetical protein